MNATPDPAHLRTFVALAEARSFSQAAQRLGLSQPTVSDHLRKLEGFAGRRLIVRDTHSKALTDDGRAMLEFARVILEGTERARRYFARAAPRRPFRIGAGEDLTTGWLSEALGAFIADHPEIDLEITVALSRKLADGIEQGGLDLAICKRAPDEEGETLFRDPLVFAAATAEPVFRDAEAQLVLYPPPSLTRALALTALGRAGVPWRIAGASDDLSGLAMAARLGLGMIAHARSLIPAGLVECRKDPRLPDLGEVEFAVMRRKRADPALADELTAAIRAKASAQAASFGGASRPARSSSAR